ncbi:MAG: GIY-YIG nuclease family protein, partial [Clostridia bacterium]
MEKKKFNYVYLTTNIVNGKQYVGDRSCNCNPEKDNYIGSGRPAFDNAKKKYGEENFKKVILEQFPTRLEAYNAQEKYIKQFNTLTPKGYNISPKGGHGPRGSWNNSSKKKLSK